MAVLQGLAAGTLLYITFYEVRNVHLPSYSQIYVSLTGAGQGEIGQVWDEWTFWSLWYERGH